MKQAEDQDEHWRNIMHSKDEQIRALQHSNGQGVSISLLLLYLPIKLNAFYPFISGYLMSVLILQCGTHRL